MIIMLTNDNDENVLYSAQIGLKMKVHTYLFIEETFGCLFMQTIANCSWGRAFTRSVSPQILVDLDENCTWDMIGQRPIHN